MVSAEKKIARRQRKVPDFLMYELMDGKPVYYQGYQEVLNQIKKPEDIMGSSALQGIILSFIVSILYKYLDQDDYWIIINEPGVHLDHKNHLAGDLLIYEKTRLKSADIKNKYVNLPANVVVEVDTKADVSKQGFPTYVKRKTTKFHEFGVDKIIWILTTSRQVIVAEPGKDWLMVDWNKDIEILKGAKINIGSYLTKNGIELDEGYNLTH